MNGDFDHVTLSRADAGGGALCIGDLAVGFAVPVATQSGTS